MGDDQSDSGEGQRPPTNDTPTQTTRSPSEIAGTLAPLLLASTAVAAALAFFMGWNYERGYVEEWGLPFSAFAYSPYDYMVASSTTLIFAIVTGYIYLFLRASDDVFDFLFGFFGSSFRAPRTDVIEYPPIFVRVLRIGVAITLAFSAYLIGEALVQDDPRQLIRGLVTLLAFLGVMAWPAYRGGSRPARAFMVVLAIVVVYVIVVVAPPRLGAADAQQDRKHPAGLPRVEFVLNRSPGIAGSRRQGGEIVSGPWRVIRVNDGRYWLIPDEKDASEVIQIDAADVKSTRYLPD